MVAELCPEKKREKHVIAGKAAGYPKTEISQAVLSIKVGDS